jgi:hypothetical protein
LHKFLYLWILWLLFLLFSTQVLRSDKLESGMILFYDAIDTSLWEVDAESMSAALFLDFDAPEVSLSPLAFLVERQSIVFMRMPNRDRGDSNLFQVVEIDLETKVETTILDAERMFIRPIPSSDAVLIEIDEGEERHFCVLFFVTTECETVSEDLIAFLMNRSIRWQNNAGYVLTDKSLYRFDLESLTWETLLDNAWLVARSAAYSAPSNSLYVAGNLGTPESLCQPSELFRVDLDSLSIELAPYEVPHCITNFSKMLVSPDERYLQYNARELVVIELETGEIIYRPFLYSIRSAWMDDSQRIVVNNAEELGSNINEISILNVLTEETIGLYEGRAGYIWLYEVP